MPRMRARHPAGGSSLTIGICPERFRVVAIGKACAGALQGKPEINIGAFYRLIVLIADLNHQRSHYPACQVVDLLVTCERSHLQAENGGRLNNRSRLRSSCRRLSPYAVR